MRFGRPHSGATRNSSGPSLLLKQAIANRINSENDQKFVKATGKALNTHKLTHCGQNNSDDLNGHSEISVRGDEMQQSIMANSAWYRDDEGRTGYKPKDWADKMRPQQNQVKKLDRNEEKISSSGYDKQQSLIFPEKSSFPRKTNKSNSPTTSNDFSTEISLIEQHKYDSNSDKASIDLPLVHQATKRVHSSLNKESRTPENHKEPQGILPQSREPTDSHSLEKILSTRSISSENTCKILSLHDDVSFDNGSRRLSLQSHKNVTFSDTVEINEIEMLQRDVNDCLDYYPDELEESDKNSIRFGTSQSPTISISDESLEEEFQTHIFKSFNSRNLSNIADLHSASDYSADVAQINDNSYHIDYDDNEYGLSLSTRTLVPESEFDLNTDLTSIQVETSMSGQYDNLSFRTNNSLTAGNSLISSIYDNMSQSSFSDNFSDNFYKSEENVIKLSKCGFESKEVQTDDSYPFKHSPLSGEISRQSSATIHLVPPDLINVATNQTAQATCIDSKISASMDKQQFNSNKEQRHLKHFLAQFGTNYMAKANFDSDGEEYPIDPSQNRKDSCASTLSRESILSVTSNRNESLITRNFNY